MMRCFSAFVFVFQHQAKGPRPVGFSDVSIVNFKTIGKLIFFLFFSFSGMRVEGVFARRCVYVPNRLQPFATLRNRSQPGRMAVPMVNSAKGSLLEVSNVALFPFAWQSWHFVTFRRVL